MNIYHNNFNTCTQVYKLTWNFNWKT